MDSLNQFKFSIAEFLETKPDNISLFWKGRVAFYALLKAHGIGPGDEVIIPAFTCVVVPNAILYTGATPIYADIRKEDYTINSLLIEHLITSDTKAILAQNTFGYSSDIDQLRKIAAKYNLLLIEDCTHGFGGKYNHNKNGTLTDASFFSTQWNKPFSTGIGGFAWCKDPAAAARMKKIESECLKPSALEKTLLKLSILIKDNLTNHTLYWQLIKTYRLISRMPGFPGSSSGRELSTIEMPADYKKQMTVVQAKRGVRAIQTVTGQVQHQHKIATIYTCFLMKHGFLQQTYTNPSNHTFLKFPLLVRNRPAFIQNAIKRNIELSDWFNSPLHPVTGPLDKWKYKTGMCPIAEFTANHIVNLPTGPNITEKRAEEVLNFLLDNLDHLLKIE